MTGLPELFQGLDGHEAFSGWILRTKDAVKNSDNIHGLDTGLSQVQKTSVV